MGEQGEGPVEPSGDDVVLFYKYLCMQIYYSEEDRAELGPICYGSHESTIKEAENDEEVADLECPLILFQSHFFIRTTRGKGQLRNEILSLALDLMKNMVGLNFNIFDQIWSAIDEMISLILKQ